MFDLTTLYQPRACTECGERISDGTRTGMCKRCYNRIAAAQRRQARKAQGLCALCEAPMNGDTHAECKACRAIRAQRCREERRRNEK